MSSKTKRITELIQKANSGSTVRIQGEVIRTLISEVDQFVQNIIEEQNIVRDAKNLPAEISQLRRTEGNEAEIAEAEQAIRDAAEIAKTVDEKRRLLRRIDDDTKALRSSIAKGLK